MLGSASKGKSGKYYPAYHCSNHGHYYRIPKQELEDTVAAFIRNLIIPEEKIGVIIDVIAAEWRLRHQGELQEIEQIAERITELQKDAKAAIQKIRLLDSPTAIKFMEDDLVQIEQQIKALSEEKAKKEAAKPGDISQILGRVKYFLEHLEELLVQQIDPVKKAQLFSLIFDEAPTYEKIKPGTPKTPLFTGVNGIFQLAKMEKSLMVISRRIELRLPG